MDLVVIGGSDAGISAGLRARELDPDCRVTLIVADEYPNFSICGIPYLMYFFLLKTTGLSLLYQSIFSADT